MLEAASSANGDDKDKLGRPAQTTSWPDDLATSQRRRHWRDGYKQKE
jgi:hypothetical protein